VARIDERLDPTTQEQIMSEVIEKKPPTRGQVDFDALRAFIEHESDLLDEGRFEEWYELFADDGVYWAPARHGQTSGFNHVSLFYDEKHTIRTRVTRLMHPMIHCQEPASHCVRIVSSIKLLGAAPERGEYTVGSKFMMIEDRVGSPRRLAGGRYTHILRIEGHALRIVQKRVDLTNCDQSFPMLTQPF
jgi:benzoate/toluate 1,2-dioxygenase beta subunit